MGDDADSGRNRTEYTRDAERASQMGSVSARDRVRRMSSKGAVSVMCCKVLLSDDACHAAKLWMSTKGGQ